MNLSRRSLLVSLPALGGLVACRAIWSTEELADQLGEAAVWKRRRPWVAVGKAYLAANPAENDLRLLTGRLVQALGWRSIWRPESIRPRLSRRVRDDFRRRRTTRVSGWVLSETEARLCAVVALRTAPAG